MLDLIERSNQECTQCATILGPDFLRIIFEEEEEVVVVVEEFILNLSNLSSDINQIKSNDRCTMPLVMPDITAPKHVLISFWS